MNNITPEEIPSITSVEIAARRWFATDDDPLVPTEEEVDASIARVRTVLGLVPGSGPSRTGRRSTGRYQEVVRKAGNTASEIGGRICLRAKLSALMLTALATMAFTATAALILTGHFVAAAVALTVACILESIDNPTQAGSKFTRRDVFIDYMSDRLTDVLLFGAIAMKFNQSDPILAWMSAAVLILVFLSSYARAQGEALRFESQGRFGRGERLVATLAGLAVTGMWTWLAGPTTTPLYVGIAVALGATIVTLRDRVWSVARASNDITLDVRWDDESFLPRFIHQLVNEPACFSIIQGESDVTGLNNSGDEQFLRLRKVDGDRVQVTVLPDAPHEQRRSSRRAKQAS
jgi:phosphatidylglycerophosphate synthase